MKLIHCSYHKCLTVYYSKVMSALFNKTLRWTRGYEHFNSLIDEFYQNIGSYKAASVNNHALDLQRIGDDFRLTRFIRDPRDLVVSGYFYHKRGAEPWSTMTNPGKEDWKVVNGTIPGNMPQDQSYSSYLNSLSEEDGLITEIEFRRNHFNSMAEWPTDDPRIKLFKYEELIGNELRVFEQMFDFYGLSWPVKKIGLAIADHFSMGKQRSHTKHIRDPRPAQWKEHFTPRVQGYFEEHHGGILERYGYERA